MAGIGIANEPTHTFVERLRALEQTKLYDLLAALPLIAWYGLGVIALLPILLKELVVTDLAALTFHGVLSLVSKTATLVFISTLIALLIFRDKPTAKAGGLLPRAAAVIGTYLSVAIVLLPAAELSDPLYFVSTLLGVVGTVFALYSLLNLGVSISMMSEARRFVTGGPYAVIRHPLYLGEGIALLGLALQHFSPAAAMILLLQCACQVLRMNNEERILSGAFPQYTDYVTRTARLIPYLY
jgi:protein-S-isoprenylcysteine O-methyltransferase Ste14